MKTEHPLSRLIGEMGLLGVYWNKKHSLFKQASPVDGLKGFADAQLIRNHLADGAIMKLSQLEDWQGLLAPRVADRAPVRAGHRRAGGRGGKDPAA